MIWKSSLLRIGLLEICFPSILGEQFPVVPVRIFNMLCYKSSQLLSDLEETFEITITDKGEI